MKKTTIYVEPQVDRALARLAENEGVTKAEIIRRSLRRTAREAPRPRLSVGVGKGEGQPLDHNRLDEYIGKYLSDELESMG